MNEYVLEYGTASMLDWIERKEVEFTKIDDRFIALKLRDNQSLFILGMSWRYFRFSRLSMAFPSSLARYSAHCMLDRCVANGAKDGADWHREELAKLDA